MKNQLSEIELSGDTVELKMLRAEHKEDLVAAASDGALWNLWYTGVPSAETIDAYIETALSDRKKGTSLPFVVIEKKSNKIIGSTRYCHAEPENRRLEIGYTWYAKSYQRTAVNSECKLLLLSHAFETLNAIAVEFRTHWHNLPSRNALAYLGAKQDGILRNHQIGPDDTYRDTVVFSIIESEWPVVRKSLEHKLNNPIT